MACCKRPQDECHNHRLPLETDWPHKGNAMEIRKIRLNNVGRFTDLEVAFAPTEKHASKVTMFVGNNGAGKTTILRSLATSLSWLVARTRSDSGSGSPIEESVLHNGSSAASISIETEELYVDFNWSLAKSRRGRNAKVTSDLADASSLANVYRDVLTRDGNASVPLIAYYPVERSVLEIPLKIKTRHSFSQLDGYDNSLNRGVDFRRFFEWFREREDSENETGISASALAEVQKFIGTLDSQIWKFLEQSHASSRDRQLAAVRPAVGAFMPGFTNLRVQRRPHLHMAIDKSGNTLDVSQLSRRRKIHNGSGWRYSLSSRHDETLP